jgi:hypothetical protein
LEKNKAKTLNEILSELHSAYQRGEIMKDEFLHKKEDLEENSNWSEKLCEYFGIKIPKSKEELVDDWKKAEKHLNR